MDRIFSTFVVLFLSWNAFAQLPKQMQTPAPVAPSEPLTPVIKKIKTVQLNPKNTWNAVFVCNPAGQGVQGVGKDCGAFSQRFFSTFGFLNQVDPTPGQTPDLTITVSSIVSSVVAGTRYFVTVVAAPSVGEPSIGLSSDPNVDLRPHTDVPDSPDTEGEWNQIEGWLGVVLGIYESATLASSNSTSYDVNVQNKNAQPVNQNTGSYYFNANPSAQFNGSSKGAQTFSSNAQVLFSNSFQQSNGAKFTGRVVVESNTNVVYLSVPTSSTTSQTAVGVAQNGEGLFLWSFKPNWSLISMASGAYNPVMNNVDYRVGASAGIEYNMVPLRTNQNKALVIQYMVGANQYKFAHTNAENENMQALIGQALSVYFLWAFSGNNTLTLTANGNMPVPQYQYSSVQGSFKISVQVAQPVFLNFSGSIGYQPATVTEPLNVNYTNSAQNNLYSFFPGFTFSAQIGANIVFGNVSLFNEDLLGKNQF